MRRKRGWVLILLAVALAGAACSRGPSDSDLVTQVQAKLYASEPLKDTKLKVTAKEGEITLAGEVPNDAARYEAYKLALETAGVRHVNDLMVVTSAKVEPPAPVEEPKQVPNPAPVRKAVKKAVPAPKTEELPAANSEPAPQPVEIRQPAPPPPPPEPKPIKVTIAAGTVLAVRMIDSIDSGVNQPGETFRASLDAPIDVEGEEVIPRGVDVTVRLDQAKSAGRMTSRGELKIELAYLDFKGKRYSLQSTAVEKVGRSEGKRTAATVGGTAAVGAIIGAIAGGGKGAAIGTIAGAGAGTAASAATKGQQVKVPSESLLEFRLEAPVTVTYMPEKQEERRRPTQ